MRKSVLVQVVICLTVLVFGTAVCVEAQIQENVTYQGNKARITVGTIKAKADNCSGDMAAAIGEMLSTALAQSGKFIVLASQEEVEELADEIELGQSGNVEEGRGPEQGLMEGADVLITGAVTSFEPEAGGAGGGLGGLKNKALGKVGLETKTAELGLDLKLIDIRTRRIIKATSIEAKSTSWGADVAGGGWGEEMVLAGELGVYSNEPMEKAVRALLVKTVQKIEKEMPSEYYRYQGKGQYSKEYGASGQAAGSSGGGAAVGSTPSGGGVVKAENMALYTKYDFIPGDKTIFYDDLSQEEIGEFPSRWKLTGGVFEVAKKGDLTLVMCSNEGELRPKMTPGLPDRYTVEWEIYSNGADLKGHWYYIHILDANEQQIAEFALTDGRWTKVTIFDKDMAEKELPTAIGRGIHTMRIMATKTTMKCYVDNERVANIPDIEYFEPAAFEVRCDPYDEQGNPMLFGKFRVAEGGKSMRQQLDETGRIITHGVLFDSGSDVIKGASFKTLAEIGQLLSDDPGLRLSIQGHTDSDGEDAYNQDLSNRRAASVKAYLVTNNQIDAARLESVGFGETKPIDANTTPEGKANNRRVELVKL